jgi:hypothetical protein
MLALRGRRCKVDYGRAFVFMFRDRDWPVKIVLGGVFMLLSSILVGIPFVLGYALELLRNVIEGRDEPLPAWDNLGEKFVQGLILLAILALLALPLMLGGCIAGVFQRLASSTRVEGLAILFGLVAAFVWLLFALYAIAYSLFAPAFVIRYAVTKEFGPAFNIRAAWSVLRANTGNYILMLIVAYVASLVSSLGTILCFIGVFLTGFWAYLVYAHLLGQYYRVYVAGSGPLPTVATV